MIPRTCLGQLYDGQYGLDVSLPGVNVLSPGSLFNLSFTTRAGSAAVVHQAGTCVRGATVNFPTLPWKPMVHVAITDGTNFIYQEYRDQISGSFKIGYTQVIGVEPLWFVSPFSFTLHNAWPSSLDGESYYCRYIVFRMPGG